MKYFLLKNKKENLLNKLKINKKFQQLLVWNQIKNIKETLTCLNKLFLKMKRMLKILQLN